LSTAVVSIGSANVNADIVKADIVEQYTYKVIDRQPQSRRHFVQGLEIDDGILYLSTGNYGHSQLLRYEFGSGKRLAVRNMPKDVFAEGLTVYNDQIFQLTWQNRRLFVYDKESLELLEEHPIPGEGWGLTHNADQLIYSDGSANLHFLDPKTLEHTRTLQVTQKAQPTKHLNELEWIDDKIWANVWGTRRIVVIDPQDGKVCASIDLTDLLPRVEYRSGTDVLNGIARNASDNSLWVTGKRWPWMYRIELVAQDAKNTAGETAQKPCISR